MGTVKALKMEEGYCWALVANTEERCLAPVANYGEERLAPSVVCGKRVLGTGGKCGGRAFGTGGQDTERRFAPLANMEERAVGEACDERRDVHTQERGARVCSCDIRLYIGTNIHQAHNACLCDDENKPEQ